MESLQSSSEHRNLEYIWIHCYKCFELMIHRKKSLYILSCTHLSCEDCLKKCGEFHICPECLRPKKIHKIGPDMPEMIKSFFIPKVSQGDMNFEIVKFQVETRNHYLQGLRKMEAFNTAYEKECIKTADMLGQRYMSFKEAVYKSKDPIKIKMFRNFQKEFKKMF